MLLSAKHENEIFWTYEKSKLTCQIVTIERDPLNFLKMKIEALPENIEQC